MILLFLFNSAYSQQVVNENSIMINNDSLNVAFSDSIILINDHVDDVVPFQKDTIFVNSEEIKRNEFIPNSTKAIWYSAIFPGLGQIYNKKYWKLPIVYGGFMGITYGLAFNQRNYTDYSIAYRDAMDNDSNTKSYEDFVPENWPMSQVQTVMKRKKDFYRRNRDLSIIGMIAMYAICMIDAYVDAELYTFDISPDLSFHIEPAIINNSNTKYMTLNSALGLQCYIKF